MAEASLASSGPNVDAAACEAARSSPGAFVAPALPFPSVSVQLGSASSLSLRCCSNRSCATASTSSGSKSRQWYSPAGVESSVTKPIARTVRRGRDLRGGALSVLLFKVIQRCVSSGVRGAPKCWTGRLRVAICGVRVTIVPWCADHEACAHAQQCAVASACRHLRDSGLMCGDGML